LKETGKVGYNIATGTPVVGHVLGGGQLLWGYREEGWNTLRKATRTTFTMGGGVAGFWAGGPLLAASGGVVGGSAYDLIETGVASKKNGEYTPQGQF
jgi:hypothetical protein